MVTSAELYRMAMKVDNKDSMNVGLFLGLIRVAYLTKRGAAGGYEIVLSGSELRVDYIAQSVDDAANFVRNQLNWKP